jgi:hypothetical protein
MDPEHWFQAFSRDCLQVGEKKSLAIVGDKIFFIAGERESGTIFLKVISRLTADGHPRHLKTLADQEDQARGVFMVACDKLLAILINTELRKGKISLWNGPEETWLMDLDISTMIPEEGFAWNIVMSKNLLAVSVADNWESYEDMVHKIHLNFWQVNTSQPEGSAPQFLGSLSFTQKPLFCVIMNDKWIGLKFDMDRCVLVLRKTELFSSDPNQTVDEPNLASSLPPVDSWRKLNVTKSGFPQDMRLEPGNSDLLAVQVQETLQLSPPGVVRILNLATGDIVHQISLGTDFLPISWCGGNLLFITKLRQEGFDQEETFQ